MTNTNHQIQTLISRGALFIVNHSGGKDSQAMMIEILKIVPAAQILVIHAHLPGMEWEGTEAHVRATIGDLPLQVVSAKKSFEDMVRHRGMWPSPQYRQCTSDLKRGPIEVAVRAALKNRACKLVVNCMGLRAQESSSRAKAEVFKKNERNSKAGREWFDWLPIHDMSAVEVFQTIKIAGQRPHPAYELGMSRLSCMFCIMASKADLRRSAELNPEAYARMVRLEREIDQTFVMPKKGVRLFLEEVTGVKVAA